MSIQFSRRTLLKGLFAGTAGTSASGWFPRLAQALEANPQRRRHCVLLWMSGGPSQMDTFDLKPGHANGGPTEAIATAVDGIKIAAPWANVAKAMKDVALVRSLTSREGQHDRAVYQMHTGYIPAGGVKHPTLGSLVASEIAPEVGDPRDEFEPRVAAEVAGLRRGAHPLVEVRAEPFGATGLSPDADDVETDARAAGAGEPEEGRQELSRREVSRGAEDDDDAFGAQRQYSFSTASSRPVWPLKMVSRNAAENDAI